MKLDKFGKKWAKLVGVIFLACSTYLLGGLYCPWVRDAPFEGKICITALFVMSTVVAIALAFLTEEETQ